MMIPSSLFSKNYKNTLLLIIIILFHFILSPRFPYLILFSCIYLAEYHSNVLIFYSWNASDNFFRVYWLLWHLVAYFTLYWIHLDTYKRKLIHRQWSPWYLLMTPSSPHPSLSDYQNVAHATHHFTKAPCNPTLLATHHYGCKRLYEFENQFCFEFYK